MKDYAKSPPIYQLLKILSLKFTQIWLPTNYENKFLKKSFYILGCPLELIIKVCRFEKQFFNI